MRLLPILFGGIMTREEKSLRREQIRNLYIQGNSAQDIADMYGITKGYVYALCKGLTNYCDKR